MQNYQIIAKTVLKSTKSVFMSDSKMKTAESELKRIFDTILLQKHAGLLKDLSLETKLQSARLQSC